MRVFAAFDGHLGYSTFEHDGCAKAVGEMASASSITHPIDEFVPVGTFAHFGKIALSLLRDNQFEMAENRRPSE